MKKTAAKFLLASIIFLLPGTLVKSQDDTLVLKDINWDKTSRASMSELFIPSANSLLAGLIYKANGGQKHPTLILLHGFPGNEKNLDLAQVVRSRGWNVIYFDYRGSWGSQGNFAFKNCVEDVVNVVAFCRKYSDSLQIDTSHIVLMGHSMGGWVCLKALQALPGIKKGFALSTWDIYAGIKTIKSESQLEMVAKSVAGNYFVLNTPAKDIFLPVMQDPAYFNLETTVKSLGDRQIIMIDEHNANKELAATAKSANKTYFEYEVWQTDHPFTNKRVALMKKVLWLLQR